MTINFATEPYRAIEVTPTPVYFDVSLVGRPRDPTSSTALGAQTLRQQRCKPCLPIPYSLVGKGKAAGQEHLRQIPQAQFVAHPPYNDEKHNVRGILKKVKGRARAFIEESVAGVAAELPIPERRAVGLFRR